MSAAAASSGSVRYVLLNPTGCGIPIGNAQPQVIPYARSYPSTNKAVRAAAATATPNPPVVPCKPNPQT